jgi:glycosyltransferase involved in cell wall biosynthesis
MIQRDFNRKFAFVIPTLGEVAAQNEDIVQLLIFASVKLEQEAARANRNFEVTIISVEHDITGWKYLSSLFSEKVLKHISIEELKEPTTPNLAIASHKPAYNLFEFLKERSFDEVHCLDRYGLAYYPTQAKQLGLYFLNTVFAVHVVGGTFFRKEVEDNLLDDVGTLMDDLLERGSLERADAVYVHDRKAWRWYADKVEMRPEARVYDLAWAKVNSYPTESIPVDDDIPAAIIYYGSLGADGGLPLFCDAVGRALTKIKKPVEVFFVGSPQAIGGMDAVSYIRLRSAKWKVPVTIKREFSISAEVTFLFGLGGVIVGDASRRESLRLRLIANSGLSVLQMDQIPVQPAPNGRVYLANPDRIAQALIEKLTTEAVHCSAQPLELIELWRTGRPNLASLEDIPASLPLQMPGDSQPKVTVCVTHFSRPQKLRLALASLKQQTYQNFEVIIVDDGSPEQEVQNELAKIQREIEPMGWRLLVQENRYLGAARNHGLSHATGEYLMFMDDDNVAKPHEISTLVAVAQRTGAGIVTAFCDVFESEITLTGRTPPPMRFTPFGSDPALGALSNCYGDANALYSRQVLDQLGGFTEDYGITHEDWELFCRASLEGIKLICVPEPLFWYRVDQSGMFRGQRTQLHKSANLRRHIRPFLEKLPYYQAKLVQLAQGLTTELPLTMVGASTRLAGPQTLRTPQERLPYARVAVIMRTKDRPLLLRRAITSVLDQTFKDWLLVIINDGGSPENVELVVAELAEELAGRVLVLHHPVSLGMQTAANAGLSNCDSDFIIIHDDDDTWEPAFLARTVSHLDERGWNPKVGGVITWSRVIVEEICEDGQVTRHSTFIFNDKLYNLSLVDLAVENRFPPISFLFRRAALDVVGPFKEQHGVLGDWEFHLRLLQRFDIEVICEPLANYHHRLKTTTGVYGNSVHTQNDEHRAKRAGLINDMVRGQIGEANGLSTAQLLVMGELHHQLLTEQGREFQRLQDYIWTVEQRIKFIASPSKQSATAPLRHNLARNGDFRLWPGVGKIKKGPGDTYAFADICPGFLLCYDGRQVSYRVESRKWIEDGRRLPFGKTYLHLENDGHTKDGSWFVLECVLSSALLLSGQTISVSGMARFKGGQGGIFVGGRYHLGDGRELTWPDQKIFLSTDFERWTCSIVCPAVQETEVKPGHNARIILKLPHDQPFEFDLTNFQVELGAVPTEFEYWGALSWRERLHNLWDRTSEVWNKDRDNVPEIRATVLARENP